MNNSTLSLTKCHLRLILKAEYKGISTVSLPNNLEIEVVVFSAKNDFVLGQSLPVMAIIVHEKSFENIGILQYVVAHEYGHYKSWWYTLPALLLAFILWMWGAFSLVFGLLSFQLGTIIVSFIMILVGCAASWLIEYKAESYALGLLGIDHVVSARELMASMPKLPLFWQILGRMTHPKFTWTLATYRFFHKG